jgi:hypothetical protein
MDSNMYFDKFKPMYYEFIIGGKKELRAVKDITTNVRFRKQLLSQITLYDEYDIQNGETPDIIAAKYYGSSEYHWVVMLANERFNYLEDFPLDYHTFELHVKEKYGDNLYDTHHHEDENGYVVNVGYPVSNYEYEDRENEKKRRIKLISPKMLSTILTNYKAAI